MICKRFKEGASKGQISRETGINRAYVAWVLQEAGVQEIRLQKDIDKEFEENKKKSLPDIIKWYEDGVNITEIKHRLEEIYNFSPTFRTISNMLKDAGVKLRHAKDYNKKYTCDESAFKSYDKYSCYWAGLLAADGCVYYGKGHAEPYIILSLKDKPILERFKEYIGYTGPITSRGQYPFEDETLGKRTYWEVRCASSEICNNLDRNFNIIPRKTYVYTPPETIPQDLIKYFILGYIDGDGSITYYTTNTGRLHFGLSVVGTYQTIHFVKKYLHKEYIKTFERHPERKINNVTMNLQGNDQLYEILGELYSDEEINSICMERKYEKYLLLKRQQEKKYSSASA